jgi:hypothetical protein
VTDRAGGDAVHADKWLATRRADLPEDLGLAPASDSFKVARSLTFVLHGLLPTFEGSSR